MKLLEFDPTLDCIAEFKAKYLGQYILIDHPIIPHRLCREGIPCTLKAIEPGQITVELPYTRTTATISPDDPDVQFARIVPRQGNFQLSKEKTCARFHRVPNRMWNKGLSSKNSLFQVPISFYDPNVSNSACITLDTISDLISTSGAKYTLAEAKEFLLTGWKSVMLDRDFSLSYSPIQKYDYAVWYYSKIVGFFNKPETVTMEKQTIQEFRDYLKSTGQRNVVGEIHEQ